MNNEKKVDEMIKMEETYAGPVPPEVSQKALQESIFQITQAADHYGWTNAELEDEMRDIADYLKKSCFVKKDTNCCENNL